MDISKPATNNHANAENAVVRELHRRLRCRAPRELLSQPDSLRAGEEHHDKE